MKVKFVFKEISSEFEKEKTLSILRIFRSALERAALERKLAMSGRVPIESNDADHAVENAQSESSSHGNTISKLP